MTSVRIFNIYGPTETTVWSTNTEILSDEDITIGKPIANTQIYIVDRCMQPVPIGVTGELCIAGDGVGAGYLNCPELTAEKFIDNPFGPGKLYKTGDLFYWREDGNIVYVGRDDFQVKIRGLRIELGEIETAMGEFPGINMAVTVDRRDENSRQYLVGYYIANGPVEEKDLRQHLAAKLPKYIAKKIGSGQSSLQVTARSYSILLSSARRWVVPVMTAYLVMFIRRLGENAVANTASVTLKTYITEVTEAIAAAVAATNQTYVDSLKNAGKFDADAQREAAKKALEACLASISPAAQSFIEAAYGDIKEYLATRIEAEVRKQKGDEAWTY